MIDISIIENSSAYIEYQKIGDIISCDQEINDLMREIKELERESVYLEYNNNMEYLLVDKRIEEKVKLLNANENYKLYLSKMQEFNNYLNEVKI